MTEWTNEPVAGQIAAHMKRRIIAGEFSPDTRLTYGTVADDYAGRGLEGANLGTARQAMLKLREEGYVQIYQGKGVLVLPPDQRDDEADPVNRRLVQLNEAIRDLDDRLSAIEQWREQGEDRGRRDGGQAR